MERCGCVGLDELRTVIERINLSHDDTSNYDIKVKKAEFHTRLLRDLLAGITTVKGISDSIESVLKALSDIIIESKDHVQDKSVWSFFNVFTWDDVTQEVKGCTFGSLTWSLFFNKVILATN